MNKKEVSLPRKSILNVEWAHSLVVFRGMMFAVVVGSIVNAMMPKIEELALGIAAF